jgi:hypothetical protein
MHTTRSLILIILSFSFVFMGCPRRYVDTDNTHVKAVTINPDIRIEDRDGLSALRGDTDDWKVFLAPKSGLCQLRVDFGDPFKETQGVTAGKLSVRSAKAELISSSNIRQGQTRYDMSFKVKGDKRYFIHLRADKGSGPYAIKYEIKKRKKRCAGCVEGQDFCRKNSCISPDAYDPPAECEDECDRGEICVRSTTFGVAECAPKSGRETCESVCNRIMDATPHYIRAKYFYSKAERREKMAIFKSEQDDTLEGCIKNCSRGSTSATCLAGVRATEEIANCSSACPGGCPRGSACNKRRRKCVKNPCSGVRCGAGERCYNGKCRKKPTAEPACVPACKKDFKCNNRKGKCEFALGPIGCTITSISASGSNTSFIVNRGSAHKIYKGDRGNLKGVGAFKIIDVYSVRSKALISKPPGTVRGNAGCVLNRKGPKN